MHSFVWDFVYKISFYEIFYPSTRGWFYVAIYSILNAAYIALISYIVHPNASINIVRTIIVACTHMYSSYTTNLIFTKHTYVYFTELLIQLGCALDKIRHHISCTIYTLLHLLFTITNCPIHISRYSTAY